VLARLGRSDGLKCFEDCLCKVRTVTGEGMTKIGVAGLVGPNETARELAGLAGSPLSERVKLGVLHLFVACRTTVTT
jgi:hypothetical protein